MRTLTGARYEALRKEVITALNKKYRDFSVEPSRIAKMADEYMAKHINDMRDAARVKSVRISWDITRDGLRDEIHSVQTRLSNARKRHKKKPSEEGIAAISFFENYLTVLLRVRDKVDYYHKLGVHTPEEAAKDKKLSTKYLPESTFNHTKVGYSWVDWIPEDIRGELLRNHASLFSKTRRHQAILTRDPNKAVREQHTKVRQAWTDDLNAMLNVIDASPAGAHQLLEAQAAMIQLALTKVEGKPFTEKLHPSWSRYISADERAAAMREADPDWQARPSNQPVEQPELPAGAHWHDDEAAPTPTPTKTPPPVVGLDDLGF